MCLAIIAIGARPEWPLIVLANRDEYHHRPTHGARPWSDTPTILAGRDLSAGGTWLGMSAQGKVALLTNYREPGQHNVQAPSRGQLVDEFLRDQASSSSYCQRILPKIDRYNGFNLILADKTELWFSSNRGVSRMQPLCQGIFGVSNASLNTPWPKLTRLQRGLTEYLSQLKKRQNPDVQWLFNMMQDRRSAPVEELPDTGVGPEREIFLGSPFIVDPLYGTRCTTLVMRRADGLTRFHEKSFDPQGVVSGESLWTVDELTEQIVSGTKEAFGF